MKSRRQAHVARIVTVALLICLAIGVLLDGSEPSRAVGESSRAANADGLPNIVVVMTDDQRSSDLKVMPHTRELLRRGGTEFTRFYDNFPLCCPSRATFLTGLYGHNHGILGNGPEEGGFEEFRNYTGNTLPILLKGRLSNPYYTGQVGKFLNGYGRDDRDGQIRTFVPGWDEWYALLERPAYYGYTLSKKDAEESQGREVAPAGYLTDRLTDRATDFIRRRMPESAPFFLWVAYYAPHNGKGRDRPGGGCKAAPKPAPGDLEPFLRRPLPRPPSFNEADVDDKPKEMRRKKLTGAKIKLITRRYRCRAASLQAVDRGVQQIIRALDPDGPSGPDGELDQTYVIFVSDNGFMMGEHRLKEGKSFVYEESSRVPLLIRGPGIPVGAVVSTVTSNADLAPTILEAAGVGSDGMDGISLLPLANGQQSPFGRDGVLIETNKLAAVRDQRFLYAEYKRTGSRELYDLDLDPFQLHNRIADSTLEQEVARLQGVLEDLRSCKGVDGPQPCRTTTTPPQSPRPPVSPPQPEPPGPTAPPTLAGVGQHEPYAITCDKARLDGWVNPHGSPTTWFFEYWERGVNVPHRTGSGDAGAGEGRVDTSRLAEPLRRDTGYSAVLIADNAAGRSISSIVSFKTRERC